MRDTSRSRWPRLSEDVRGVLRNGPVGQPEALYPHLTEPLPRHHLLWGNPVRPASVLVLSEAGRESSGVQSKVRDQNAGPGLSRAGHRHWSFLPCSLPDLALVSLSVKGASHPPALDIIVRLTQQICLCSWSHQEAQASRLWPAPPSSSGLEQAAEPAPSASGPHRNTEVREAEQGGWLSSASHQGFREEALCCQPASAPGEDCSRVPWQ